MRTYKLHLIRHGLTQGNREGRYVGHTDIPLCQQGREEIKALAERFSYPKVHMVVSSPLSRCVETAKILYPESYTEQWKDFIECNFGAFEGKRYDELAEDFEFFNWISGKEGSAPPGGESVQELTARTSAGLGRLFKKMMDESMDSVALVTHGGVITTLLHGMGLPKMPIENCFAGNGRGFTLLLSPDLWMRSGVFEVYGIMPHGVSQEQLACNVSEILEG